jgi:hypothetical protein
VKSWQTSERTKRGNLHRPGRDLTFDQQTAYGVMGTVNEIGDLVARLIVGFLWTVVSPTAGFVYAAAAMLVGSVLVHRLR